MKKRVVTVFLTGLLAASMLLGGCTSKSEKKALEYKELGIKQLQQEDYDGAVDSFQKALDQSLGRITANELDVCYYKALAQYKSGDAKAALESYSALIDYDEKNWEVYYLRGSVYLSEGDKDKCLKDYEKAVELNASDLGLYGHICENLKNAGEDDEAEKYLEQGLALQPSSGTDYENVGYLYTIKGDTENAVKAYQQAVEKGTDSASLKLGELYFEEGNTDEAKKAFEAYMEKHPDDADALTHLADIAAESGDTEDAAAYYEKAIDVADKSDQQGLRKNLVAFYENAGDFASALKEAKSYVADYPKDTAMQKEYEFLQTRVENSTGDAIEGTVDDGTSADTTSSDSSAASDAQ